MTHTQLEEFDFFAYEKLAKQNGFFQIAGVDEAGRGPLAGPVVAAACIIPEGLVIEGVNDSKQLTPEKRAKIFDILISSKDVQYGIGVLEADEIDQINILQATFKAMQRAVENLKIPPDFVLVDGSLLPKWKYPSRAIVKGDSLSYSIAAASILAKETRDELMKSYEIAFPGYGFGKHKGYGTKAHIEAIERLGPCLIHRKTFEPIKSLIASLSFSLQKS